MILSTLHISLGDLQRLLPTWSWRIERYGFGWHFRGTHKEREVTIVRAVPFFEGKPYWTAKESWSEQPLECWLLKAQLGVNKMNNEEAYHFTAKLTPGKSACLKTQDGEHHIVVFLGLLPNDHGMDAIIRWSHSDIVTLDSVHWSRLHPIHANNDT